MTTITNYFGTPHHSKSASKPVWIDEDLTNKLICDPERVDGRKTDERILLCRLIRQYEEVKAARTTPPTLAEASMDECMARIEGFLDATR